MNAGTVRRLSARVKSLQLRLAMVALVVMMSVTVVDVIRRYLFNAPITGAYNMVEASLVVFVFHGMSACFFARKHIVIDLIDTFVPPAFAQGLRRLADLVTVGLIAAIGWAMISPALQAHDYGDRKLELGLPLSILWVTAIVGVAGNLVAAIGALVGPAVKRAGEGPA